MSGVAGTFVDHVFRDVAAPAAEIERGEYERVRFEGCTFTGARFVGCHFDDVVFANCELTTASFLNSTLRGARFTSCRVMGVNWTNVRPTLLSLAFERCRLDNSTFSGMKLRGLVAVDCGLVGVDFTSCDLTGARFPTCDLAGAILRHAVLDNADLTGTRGCFFDARTCKTSGTRIDIAMAAQLVRDLGMVCPDLDAMFGPAEPSPARGFGTAPPRRPRR